MTGKKGMKLNQKRSQLYIKPLVKEQINKEIDDETAIDEEFRERERS